MSAQPLLHLEPQSSEAEAAEKISRGRDTMKSRILDAMWANEDAGLTPDEYQRESGTLINSVRKRFVELRQDGKIRPSDITRLNSDGNQETVWVLGRDENYIRQRESKDQKIARLEAEVRELRARLA